MKWDSKLYDNAQNFVSEYGKGLIEFIPNKENQNILDLGCGTGDLTNEINRKLSVNIIGTDTENKVRLLLDFANKNKDIADPWYTGNFDETYKDVVCGCTYFLQSITRCI